MEELCESGISLLPHPGKLWHMAGYAHTVALE